MFFRDFCQGASSLSCDLKIIFPWKVSTYVTESCGSLNPLETDVSNTGSICCVAVAWVPQYKTIKTQA